MFGNFHWKSWRLFYGRVVHVMVVFLRVPSARSFLSSLNRIRWWGCFFRLWPLPHHHHLQPSLLKLYRANYSITSPSKPQDSEQTSKQSQNIQDTLKPDALISRTRPMQIIKTKNSISNQNNSLWLHITHYLPKHTLGMCFISFHSTTVCIHTNSIIPL